MKKIKLKFRNSSERFSFYDIAWCRGFEYPQCETCRRNPKRYENWAPPGCYTGWGMDEESHQKAAEGDCKLYTEDK